MEIVKGKGVSGGIAFGRIFFFEREETEIKKYSVNDIESEIKRFKNAKSKAIEELKVLYRQALSKAGKENAEIFNIHQMMLDDDDYCDSITGIIASEQVNAEYAVKTTESNFAEMFSKMDDSYMKERAADVMDISKRLIGCLSNTKSKEISAGSNVILVADDLTPSETIQLDRTKIAAFATIHGSSNSHASILARTMNMPALADIKDGFKTEYNGKEAIADGFSGTLYIEPNQKTIKRYTDMENKLRQENKLLQELKGKENITHSGEKIKVYANIGNVSDAQQAVKNDAGGIGLFRSEFLYIGKKDFPTEEEQFEVYKSVAEIMADKDVIIRTLDIGADKQAEYFHLPKETNPALGYRAIRICLTQEDIFKTQLRALYRASAFGKISIMFPMITSVWEVRQINDIVKEVRNELKNEGISYNENTPLGIMIETPAAALISDELAKEVDFFSIGTNDLTQYTLAADRQNQNIEKFFDPHHKAVLKLIEMTAENAHKNGIWVGICGELGADTALTEAFLNIGIDEISVSPPRVLPLRKKIREI